MLKTTTPRTTTRSPDETNIEERKELEQVKRKIEVVYMDTGSAVGTSLSNGFKNKSSTVNSEIIVMVFGAIYIC